jgi:signal transduction histidine kinase
VKITFKTIAILSGLSILSIAIFYLMNLHNRRAVESQTLALAVSEGKTIEKVMEKASLHLLEKGENDLIRFLDEIFRNEQVIYIALSSSGGLLHAASKFEGYLPIETDSRSIRTFASPMGEIIEVTASLRNRSGRRYKAHIGYFFNAIGEIHSAAKKNFLLLTLMQGAMVLLIIAFLSRFNRQMTRKELEIQGEKEKREKLQEISLITAGINHEIKNPLHALYLNYQMLEPLIADAGEDALFHSRSLKREIGRINEIIDRFSQLNHAIKIKIEKINLADFFSDLQTVSQEMAPALRISCQSESQMALTSDRNLLCQVFDNLVRNAAEAGAGHLEIIAAARRDTTTFSIKDDGPGIKKEHLPYIFDPFVSFKSRGSGIGLALTRKIIMLLGGRIEVESVEGHGTEFKIYL